MKIRLNNIIFIAVICITLFYGGFAEAKSRIQGPTLGEISSRYGYRNDPFSGQKAFHKGIDIACHLGTPIYAMQDGVVTFSGRDGGYGRAIVIDHFFSDIPELPRVQTKYAHNSKHYVKSGDIVKRGQIIALSGSTGRSTGPHVHFEVIYKNSPVDPIDYLTKLPRYLEYARHIRNRRNKYRAQNTKIRQAGG